jgi:hypothetical protein
MKKILIIFSVLFFFGNIASANSSQVFFAGPSAAFAPQSEFNVSIFLDSTEPVNALDLEIAYPPDQLAFLSFDNTHSIVDIWQTSPKIISNGNIHLVGGIFKSFSGNNGLVIKLAFRALNAGEPALSFAKSNIYIADGKGTQLSLGAPASTLSVAKNAPLLSLPGIANAVAPPPEIIVQQTKSPVDGVTLIVFQATAPDSGIQKTQMRVKKWLAFSPWQDVQNPVAYPAGAWNVELRAVSFAGAESIKSITSPGELFKKLFILLLALLILVFGFIRVYNRRK